VLVDWLKDWKPRSGKIHPSVLICTAEEIDLESRGMTITETGSGFRSPLPLHVLDVLTIDLVLVTELNGRRLS